MLSEILKAKEQRHAIRQEFAKDGYATISLNFNIPGYPKSNNSIKTAFLLVKKEFQKYLNASRIKIFDQAVKVQHDQAGDVCFFPFKQSRYDLKEIKNDLESFEEKHLLNRLIDVDIFDRDQKPVSSGKKKACFLCKDKTAIECMRENNHTYNELESYVSEQIQSYLESVRKYEVCNKLSALATQSILLEILLPGKPGLVCPNNQGSHTDMNYITFLNSTSAISPYFIKIAKMGYCWDGVKNKSVLQELRKIGLEMEQTMFRTTRGVNTQKGIIFLMGFSLFAASHVIKTRKTFDASLFREILKLLNKGIVEKELENGWNKNPTHGEKCFTKFGKEIAGGIRLEIEHGFPSVFEVSLPFMHELFPNGFICSDQNIFHENLLRILIKIMSVNNDTNILHRTNIDVLNKIKTISSQVKKSEGNLSSDVFYKELVNLCKTHNVSPGGSADLLSITVFVYLLEDFG